MDFVTTYTSVGSSRALTSDNNNRKAANVQKRNKVSFFLFLNEFKLLKNYFKLTLY